MEFRAKITKSLSPVVHSSPHASRGKLYLNKFHNVVDKGSTQHITPPRNRKFNFSRKSASALKLKSYSRAGNIIKNSQILNSSKESPKQSNILTNSQVPNSSKESPKKSKWISKVNDFQSPVRAPKRPFRSLNLDSSSDPHSVFSDDDDDDEIFLSAKHDRMLERDLDKENNNLRSPITRVVPKVYPSTSNKKKKIINLSKTLLHDISPDKIDSLEFEENKVPFETKKTFKFRPYIGCESTPTKKEEIKPYSIEHPHMIGFPNFGNTCYLNAVLQTVISLQPFIVDLSNVLQTVNVSSTSLTSSLWDIISARDKLDSFSVKNSLRSMKGNVEKINGSFSGFKMQDANEFLTQVLDTVKDEVDKCSLLNQNNNNNKRKGNTCDSNLNQNKNSVSLFDSPSSSSPVSLEVKLDEDCDTPLDEDDLVFVSPKQKDSETPTPTPTPLSPTKPIEQHLINPVSNNFEFELFESFRCLGCGATEGRRQKHFALYVDLPCDGTENIQSAVEAYMSEDKRELTCSKCQHNQASFLTSFLKLPRVLIVQMKRYEYKPEQLECIKVSSRVNINMWLHLDKLISEDSCRPPKYATKSISDFKCKPPLRELDLSSELNICSQPVVDATSTSDIFVETPNSNSDEISKEDRDLQEVINRSLEEVKGDANHDFKVPDKEEEEFQEAIRLSLIDTGMCYSHQEPSQEPEQPEVQSSDENEENGMHSYHLLSVISHFGLTTCTGHYVSDVLNVEESRWYHYDDESVTSLPESVLLSEGRQKNGYIFFYVHQDTYRELRNKK